MGIGPGDVLLALVEGQRLVLEKREAVLQRLLRRYEHVPAEVSLSDEVIAERRSAAHREGGMSEDARAKLSSISVDLM